VVVTIEAIKSEVFIEAPVGVVWELVTQPENLNQWWTDEAEFVLEPGGTGQLVWIDKASSHRDMTALTIESVVEHHFFSFRWVYEIGETPREGNSMLVEFYFESRDGGTLLRLEESGLESMPWSTSDKESFSSDHGHGWSFHLATLREYAQAKVTNL
jgi:uncharacterized protein YndB with AHSA1/START domain